MTDFGAIGGAIMISDQLAMYETMASSRRARQNRGLADEIAELRYQNAEIVDHYNTLVQNFNQLQGYAADIAAQHDRQAQNNAELRARIDELERHAIATKRANDRDKARIDYLDLKLRLLREDYVKLAPGTTFLEL